jgi:hypothetical protein
MYRRAMEITAGDVLIGSSESFAALFIEQFNLSNLSAVGRCKLTELGSIVIFEMANAHPHLIISAGTGVSHIH